MTRAEMLLKVVMSPLEPSVAFVEQYVRLVQGECGGGGERRPNLSHFADTDATELTKLLDMKGVRRSEQAVFLDQFRDNAPTQQGSPRYQPGSPAMAALTEESRVKKLEKLIKKRL